MANTRKRPPIKKKVAPPVYTEEIVNEVEPVEIIELLDETAEEVIETQDIATDYETEFTPEPVKAEPVKEKIRRVCAACGKEARMRVNNIDACSYRCAGIIIKNT